MHEIAAYVNGRGIINSFKSTTHDIVWSTLISINIQVYIYIDRKLANAMR